VRPPSHHRDEAGDLFFMKIEYEGYEVELAVRKTRASSDRRAGHWLKADINFDSSVECASRVCPFR
jgi:hypothetical protein